MSEQRQIIEELLLCKLTGELSSAEEARLSMLLAENPEFENDADELEQAAATVWLAACAEHVEPMPARLKSRLESDAMRMLVADSDS